MKGSRSWGFLFAVLLIPCLSAPAFATGLAAGAFGVYNFPILQDDAAGGALYGLKAKIGVPVVVLEPSLTFISVGDKENEDDAIGDFTQKGGSITSYGLNVSLGGMKEMPGVGFYGTGGIGAYALSSDLDYKEDETRFGFNVGAGLVFKVSPKFDIDMSGRFIVITLDGGGSRKSVGLFTGLNFYFGS